MASREEYIRKLQKSIMDGLKDKTCGEQRDIVVYINHSVPEEYTTGLVQQIEKALDEALSKVGFTRSKKSVGDIVEIVYWQFGIAINRETMKEEGIKE